MTYVIGYALLYIKQGIIGVSWTEIGLFKLTLPYNNAEAAIHNLTNTNANQDLNIQVFTKPNSTNNSNKLIKSLHIELNNYFKGKKHEFNFQIDLNWCTDFQKRVFEVVKNIPYGCTLSYKEIAQKINKPTAARAVGNALNKNKLPIIIPCHRVINSNRTLGGFSYGTAWKEKLLKLEKTTAK